MKSRNLILFTTALLFCSCLPSLKPFYTEKDVVFDTRLVGEWQAQDKSNEPGHWKFEKADGKAYQLTIVEKNGRQGEFNARLFQLRGNYFLDIIPSDCDYATNQADLVSFAMYPGHLLVRVSQFEPELKLAFFDFDWLGDYLEKNPKALAHHAEDKRIVLTAETRDLQRFVLKHLAGGKLFQEPGALLRTNTPAAPVR